jgi:hypothetical protein
VRLVRSFPEQVPAGRNYVVDDAPRLLNRDHDYRGLIDLADDVIQLDWDTAVGREDVEVFAKRARDHPDRVLVAPVLIYPGAKRSGLTTPVWNCRRYLPGGAAVRYCTPEDPAAHLFGFGMVYLPAELLAGFGRVLGSARFPRFGDMEFARWHHQHVTAEAEIAWDVRPVHLHFRISEVPL